MKTILEFSYSIVGDYGVSIIILSVIVNILILPLYYFASKWKDSDKAIQDSMRREIDNIKRYYKGQERHFYVQTIYRRYNYHPMLSIKASIGFLIQIPFFFAAFHLLSNYQELNGISFGLLPDLGKPDHLLDGINILPIMMTLINLLSAYIYIELLSKSEKIQLLSLAFIFLILLYNEPAGLLLYWTTNNIFSLLKNILKKRLRQEAAQVKYIQNKSSKILHDTPIVETIIFLIVLYLYMSIISEWIPTGINMDFLVRAKTYILSLLIVPGLFIWYVSVSLNGTNKYNLYKIEKHMYSDFILLLLPLTPIIRYLILNQDIITLQDTLYVIAVTSFISIVFVIVLPVLLSIFIPRYILMSLGLSLIFLLFYMPTLASLEHWHMSVGLKLTIPLLLLLFIFLAYSYRRNHKYHKVLIVIFFISSTILILNPDRIKNLSPSIAVHKNDNHTQNKIEIGDANNTLIKKISKSKIDTMPDIFLLIYDAYPNHSMMNNYAIDNNQQERYLKNNGFKIYNGIYSIGGSTLESMSTLLDMSNNIIHFNSRHYRDMIAGQNNVYYILKRYGYKIATIFPDSYIFGKSKPRADIFYPEVVDQGYKILLNSIFMGEFTSDANQRFAKSDKKTFEAKKRYFLNLDTHPKFIYTHLGEPGHSLANVKCRENEIDIFEDRVKIANIEMKKDVDIIIKNNPNSLIIIAGDHGPYIKGNCLMFSGFKSSKSVSRINVQDSFGAFLAIKWPKGLKPIDQNITVLQDVFPSIFATLLNDKSIFNKLKVTPNIIDDRNALAGVTVENGIIRGGIDDGKPLFLGIKKGNVR